MKDNSSKREKILILGGTAEATELAKKLVENNEVDFITSLAGRTREPKTVPGKMRIGGFGGIEAMANYIRDNNITKIIDATHPYAEKISSNARKAAKLANIPLEILTRPEWQQQSGDDWHHCESLDAAAEALPIRSTVFLALGSQHLAAFFRRDDVRFIIRMIDPPNIDLPFRNYSLILGRPGQSVEEEEATFRDHNITALVCRNSGGTRGYNKILAARECGLPVYLIARPDVSRNPPR